jgi:hypothetical protein
VEYDGQGPRAFMGWLQVVERRDDDGNAAVEVDAVPVFGEESPLYTFGYAPTLADFPANPTDPDGSWTAFAFLVAIPDVMRSRRLEVITGVPVGLSTPPRQARTALRAHAGSGGQVE